MDARLLKVAALAATLLSFGANWRSENFIIVAAPSDESAKELVAQAEHYRRELAIQWLGRELPPWREPCPLAAYIGPREPSRGKTTFVPTGGVPENWQMEVFGTRERVLDSVLPHEVLHTVFASHFGVPLPRWADEGACTTVEHVSERSKQEANLVVYLKSDRGIAFNKMFAMTDYPRDMLPLYAQGYSVARFLIAQGGQRKFVDFIGDGLANRSWTRATQRQYGYQSLAELQNAWLDWVKRGSPPISPHAEPTRQQLADSDPTKIDAQLSRVRGGDALATDGRNAPRPPTTFSNNAPSEPTSVARPESSGWYKRQRERPAATRPADPANPMESNPHSREQQIDVVAPTEVQGSGLEDLPAKSKRRLVPLESRKRQAAGLDANASRRVLVEWSRPAHQPWTGGPVAEVAMRSEPRVNSSQPSGSTPEYFDAPLTVNATLWR